MIKLLFICHGNICRSPMAEFIMKDIVKKEGMEKQFEIASAATSQDEIGNPVYPPAKKELNKHHLSCEKKTARQMTKKDYDYYDYLIAMDHYNLTNIKVFVGDDPLHKVSLLMSYTGHSKDVVDPWYTGNFEKAFDDIEKGCQDLFQQIKKAFD